MAKISDKNIKDLSKWDDKELRKLKIMANNKLSSLMSPRSKTEVSDKHLLSGYDLELLRELLINIQRAEKVLKSISDGLVGSENELMQKLCYKYEKNRDFAIIPVFEKIVKDY